MDQTHKQFSTKVDTVGLDVTLAGFQESPQIPAPPHFYPSPHSPNAHLPQTTPSSTLTSILGLKARGLVSAQTTTSRPLSRISETEDSQPHRSPRSSTSSTFTHSRSASRDPSSPGSSPSRAILSIEEELRSSSHQEQLRTIAEQGLKGKSF